MSNKIIKITVLSVVSVFVLGLAFYDTYYRTSASDSVKLSNTTATYDATNDITNFSWTLTLTEDAFQKYNGRTFELRLDSLNCPVASDSGNKAVLKIDKPVDVMTISIKGNVSENSKGEVPFELVSLGDDGITESVDKGNIEGPNCKVEVKAEDFNKPNVDLMVQNDDLTCKADINRDGSIDLEDVKLISQSFGKEVPSCDSNDVSCRVDTNKDQKVDSNDINVVTSRYGKSLPENCK